MTTQRRITRPGLYDNEFMLVTCTPDATTVEFFEFEGEATDAARENLHPSTSTFVGKVLRQGDHAVRGTASNIALLAPVDQELRNILRKQFGATNRKQIAAALQAMLDGQLEALRKVGRGEETDREHTHPGIEIPKCARGRVCSEPPCYPDCSDFAGSGHPAGPFERMHKLVRPAVDRAHRAIDQAVAAVQPDAAPPKRHCTCPPSPVPTFNHDEGCPSKPGPRRP